MSATISKIKREIQRFSDLKFCEEIGAYIMFNPNSLMELYIMVIGPNDTPYEGGFYFFHLTLPSEYPFVPPRAKYLTQWKNIRFNPNLYQECGKVCLSILGTWDGPGWTAVMGIEYLIRSIIAQVMNDNPLTNEPGYKDYSKTSPEAYNYNNIVAHGNQNRAIIQALEGDIPVPNEYKEFFMKHIKSHFKKNYEKYVNVLNNLIKTSDNKTFSCRYQSQEQTTNYKPLLKKLGDIYLKLCES